MAVKMIMSVIPQVKYNANKTCAMYERPAP